VNSIVVSNCVGVVSGIFHTNALSSEDLSLAARRYLLMRCEQMDERGVADAVEMMIGANATWVVTWGVLTGAVLGIASRVLMWF
jgi:hypothetical protein